MTRSKRDKTQRVFLSASIPPLDLVELRRREDAWEDYYYGFVVDPEEVEAAVRGLATQLLGAGVTLVFGGHPAITPILTDIGRRVQRKTRITIEIFQSAFFAGMEAFDRETDAQVYPRIRWTPICCPSSTGPEPQTRDFEVGEYPEESAEHRRESTRLETLGGDEKSRWRAASLEFMRTTMIEGCAAGVFVGGMGGVEDEFLLFQDLNPGCPVWLVSRPGGRTARLVQRFQTDGDSPTFPWHSEMGRDYDGMALRMLRELR